MWAFSEVTWKRHAPPAVFQRFDTGQANENLQLDLGTGRREYVTTVDKPPPREFRASTAELLRGRVVNQCGSDASKWFMENKTAINAWHSMRFPSLKTQQHY